MSPNSTQDMPPFDPSLVEKFIREIHLQCRFALSSFTEMSNSIYRSNRSTEDVFFYAHSFLTHAAMVSKVLRPSSSKVHHEIRRKISDESQLKQLERLHEHRGEWIRNALGIANREFLLDRDFRNHLEHYDERLEVWSVTSLHKNSIDMSIVDRNSISGIEKTDFHRVIDPTSLEMIFQGEQFDLLEHRREIEVIFNAADTWLAHRNVRF